MPRRRCAVCGTPAEHDPLILEQAEEHTPLCSFECVISHAVNRIRERRDHHNEQLAELRKALRGTEQAKKTRS